MLASCTSRPVDAPTAGRKLIRQCHIHVVAGVRVEMLEKKKAETLFAALAG